MRKLGVLGATLAVLTASLASASIADAHAARDLSYVALGDSVSAGSGTWPKISDGDADCRQSEKGYPYLYFRANIGRMRSFDLNACHGATIEDVRSKQTAGLNAGTTLVTLTAGAADLRLWSVTERCIESTWEQCSEAYVEAADTIVFHLADRLARTYSAIKQAAPNAEVVVFGYPYLFNEQVPDTCGLLDQRSRMLVNMAVHHLNEAIREQALKVAGFSYSDVNDAFEGHRLCDTGDQWVYPTYVPQDARPESFHPTESGYSAGYLTALNSAV